MPSGARPGAERSRRAAPEPPPLRVAPMRASDGDPPDFADRQWVYQPEWPGLRTMVHLDPPSFTPGVRTSVRIYDAHGTDITHCFPELDALAHARAGHPVVLDGVLVPVGGDRGWSVPSRQPTIDLRPGRVTPRQTLNPTGIAYRLAATSTDDGRTRLGTAPVRFMVLDIVHAVGHRIADLPYAERRRVVREEVPPGDVWQVAPDFGEASEALIEARQEWGLSTLVAKRLDSRYFAGLESPSWVRIPFAIEAEVTVIGWIRSPHGGRLSALLLAEADAAAGGRLRFAGVTTDGISRELRNAIRPHLARLATDVPPLPHDPATASLHDQRLRWLRPELRLWVAARDRRADGTLLDPLALAPA